MFMLRFATWLMPDPNGINNLSALETGSTLLDLNHGYRTVAQRMHTPARVRHFYREISHVVV